MKRQAVIGRISKKLLGKIDWELFFDDIDDVMDKDGDIDLWKTANVREDLTSTLHSNSRGFSKIFSQWIDKISYPKSISKNKFLKNHCKKTSIFLNFNYTKTLEDIYGIEPEQFFCIHGTQGQEIIIGHGVGNSDRCTDSELVYEYGYGSVYDIGMERLDDIHDSLRKPTKQIIKMAPFFKELKEHEIDNIFLWGFSFSNVDCNYIREICTILDTRYITWYLNDWKINDVVLFEKILFQSGFKGGIRTFNAQD